MILEKYQDLLPSKQCLEWPCARSKAGYGQIWDSATKRVVYVHRIAFLEANGRQPVGEVRHTCDNPACFNPAHLIDGSHLDNMHDMLRRMRQPATKLNWERVAELRREYATGTISQRQLAKNYNVSQRVVGMIIHNVSWPEEAAP